MDQNMETHAIIQELARGITRGLMTDAERTYYEYHGKLDDGNHIVDAYENSSDYCEEGYYAIEEAGL